MVLNELLETDSWTKGEKNAIEELIMTSKILYEANHFVEGSLTYRLIDDEIYDRLLEKYKVLVGHEPFQRSSLSGMRTVDQDYPELAGTLDKAYTVFDTTDKPSVEKWLRKISKETGKNVFSISIALKYDGTSVTGTFERVGNFYVPVKGTTRGDFENNKGVDLKNVFIGRTAEYGKIHTPEKLGVQFEAIMTESGRKALNKITGIDYSTRRAAIASAMKRLTNPNTTRDELEQIAQCITLVPLNVDDETIKKSNVSWDQLMSSLMGSFLFTHEPGEYIRTDIATGTVDQLLEFVQARVLLNVSERNSLNFSIDGLVISIIDGEMREDLGRVNNKNRWQIAYKFNALVQRTHVTGIVSTQGKQGFIGHNITFDPIEFNGVKYDKAPVSTIERFKSLDLKVGDEVLVSYNADVMGYIYKDATCKPNKKGEPIELPENCFNCGSKLVVIKDMQKCINDDCLGHKVGRILEAIRVFEIDLFGEETAHGLVKDAGITNTVAFIEMTHEDLSKVLKGENLAKAWAEFRNKIIQPISLAKVIDLLRIPSLRTRTVEKILAEQSAEILLDKINNRDEKELTKLLKSVRGIDKNAKVFAEGLIAKAEELDELLKRLTVMYKEKEEAYEKTILISGFRNNPEFFDVCKRLNFKASDSTSNYDMLVVTPDRANGSKAARARKKGVEILTLQEFMKLYKM